jgi:hypothetical protein
MLARNFWVVFGGIWFVVGAAWLVGGLVAFAMEVDEDPALLATFVAGGAALSVVGGLIAGKGLRDARTRRRLAEGGVSAEAIVTEVRRTNARVNGRWQWQVRYRYADFLGGSHEGRSGYLSYEEANAWKPGDAGPIRYDEARPKTSVWLGTAPGLPPLALEP